jgi:hypothetical protein
LRNVAQDLWRDTQQLANSLATLLPDLLLLIGSVAVASIHSREVPLSFAMRVFSAF